MDGTVGVQVLLRAWLSAGHSLTPQNNEVDTFSPYFTGVITYSYWIAKKGQEK